MVNTEDRCVLDAKKTAVLLASLSLNASQHASLRIPTTHEMDVLLVIPSGKFEYAHFYCLISGNYDDAFAAARDGSVSLVNARINREVGGADVGSFSDENNKSATYQHGIAIRADDLKGSENKMTSLSSPLCPSYHVPRSIRDRREGTTDSYLLLPSSQGYRSHLLPHPSEISIMSKNGIHSSNINSPDRTSF